MVIQRATKIKIGLDRQAAKATIEAWNDACNFASKVAFENGPILNPSKLQKLIYYEVRERFGLSAQVTSSVFRHVTSKYKALKTQKKHPKKPVVFRNSAVALQGGVRGRDFSFTESGLSVWTTAGRIKPIAFQGEPKLSKYISEWQLGDGRLYVSKKGHVYISVSFKKEVDEVSKPNDAVVGVDRGINNLAVVTDGKRSLFFGGGQTKHVRTRYQKTRSSLQRKKAQKNTRSIRRVLKRQSGKQARFTKDTNHVISKRIVEFAKETGNPTIALEELKGIREGHKLRKAQRTDLNQWAFYQLDEYITYKAASEGFEVIKIDPKYTSQGCSVCGYTAKSNRKRHSFTCGACGNTLNADLNAARNIRLRGIIARQSLDDDGLCQSALKHAPSGDGQAPQL